MHSLTHIIILTLAWLSSLTVSAKVLSISSSRNLITGENCYITFVIESPSTTLPRPEISVPDAYFEVYDAQMIRQGGKRFYLLAYRFNSPNPGTFTIPSTSFSGDLSEPITLTVRKKNSLIRKEAISSSVNDSTRSAKKSYPYYTQLVAEKTSLYPNEVTKLEYKIYIPDEINVAQWGLPTGPKTNATAWRFETPDRRTNNGDVVIEGKRYQVGRFQTTVSGIKPGKSILGEFKARIVHNTSVIYGRGARIETHEFYPLSDQLELNILELPPNPPIDFKGDVGNFEMDVTIESKAEIKTTESIKANVVLTGRGKFSEISPPSLTNDSHWKLISETKRDLGDLRKEINAFAEFSYLIQPEKTAPEGPTTTPGFSFSYLDPDLKEYRTLSSPGVPVSIKYDTSEIALTETNGTPSVNQMLGIIDDLELTSQRRPWYKSLPLSLIHLIPGLISILLLSRYTYKKVQARRLSLSHKIIQRKSLVELERHHGEPFLKAACNYIQRWVDTEKHPELRDIQHLRDDHCYKPEQQVKLSQKRKNAIIHTLRKLIILIFLITPQITDASAASLWKNSEYEKALKQYKTNLPSDSADLLYNIGNCYQKLEQTGKAALYYHRALLSEPHHSRARHNLTLIQQQNDSIITNNLVKKDSLKDWISILSHTTYYIILSLSLWFIVITILWLKILKPTRYIYSMFSLALLAFFTASFSAYGYFQHPDREKIIGKPFAIVKNSADLMEQPISPSETIITIPAASECHILTTRADYSYILLADKTQGWIQSSSLSPLIE